MNKIKSLTVYLGSSGHARRIFYEQAYALGKKIGQNGIELVFGGMNAGSMRSLSQGVLENGGQVTGIIPTRIRDSERVSKDITRLIDVDSMWERKKLMFNSGDALIMMPGGYGTLDEGLEAVYWKLLGLHDKDIIFVNIEGFWSPLFDYIHAATQTGDMDKQVQSLFSVVNKIEKIDVSKITLSHNGSQENHFPHFEDEIFIKTRTPLIFDMPNLRNTYKLMTALVTKQLGAHERSIGVLNKGGQFSHLLSWIKLAAKERFITQRCPSLLTARKTERGLMEALERKEHIVIDLHRDKWGE